MMKVDAILRENGSPRGLFIQYTPAGIIVQHDSFRISPRRIGLLLAISCLGETRMVARIGRLNQEAEQKIRDYLDKEFPGNKRKRKS